MSSSFPVFSQDTIRYYNHLKISTNPELESAISLYRRYIDEKSKGGVTNYRQFWRESEIDKYNVPDLASHYMLPKNLLAIMGVAKLDSTRYLLKTVGFMDGTDNEIPEIMYVYNYVVHKSNGSYKLGNYLDYILDKKGREPFEGSYGIYYGYNPTQQVAVDSLFSGIEVFFNTKFDQKFTIINFSNGQESLHSRGYDYFIGALNSKTTIWDYLTRTTISFIPLAPNHCTFMRC